MFPKVFWPVIVCLVIEHLAIWWNFGDVGIVQNRVTHRCMVMTDGDRVMVIMTILKFLSFAIPGSQAKSCNQRLSSNIHTCPNNDVSGGIPKHILGHTSVVSGVVFAYVINDEVCTVLQLIFRSCICLQSHTVVQPVVDCWWNGV